MKVYKRNDKLVVYLPFEVIKQLGLKGDEEMDFFKFSDKAFLFAKKEDITNMLVGAIQQRQPQPGATEKIQAQVAGKGALSSEEIAVLKKLDTLRYPQRTAANVDKLLNESEKKVLQVLISKKAVSLYKQLYSISKDVYDKFLMRKKVQAAEAKEPAKASEPPKSAIIGKPFPAMIKNENVEQLEKNGFIVLQTEAEASSLSLAMEDSIRHGMVLGTRSFNKKFYIILRSFFDANSGKIIKALKDGPKSIKNIVSETGADEDAARSILYLLAEQGDVSERREDVFALT